MMRAQRIPFGLLFCFLLSSFGPFSFTPPGTKKLQLEGEELYMDRTEVLNAHWAEYLSWLEEEHGRSSEEYHRALPEEPVWCAAYGESIGEIKSLSGKYARYPVVGVSLEQAKAYCDWRSDRVNEKYERHRTRYRLPKPDEFKKGLDEEERSSTPRNIHHYPRRNKLKETFSRNMIQGLRNRVDEMTADPDSILRFDGKKAEPGRHRERVGSATLGFRCIAMVEE